MRLSANHSCGLLRVLPAKGKCGLRHPRVGEARHDREPVTKLAVVKACCFPLEGSNELDETRRVETRSPVLGHEIFGVEIERHVEAMSHLVNEQTEKQQPVLGPSPTS